MKRLLLLLIIPILSYSQTYDDIMNMTSEKNFKITMIDNDYRKITEQSDDLMIVYGLDYEKIGNDKISFEKMGYYIKSSDRDMFMIVTDKTDYKTITESIKRDCEFTDILDLGVGDYLCYKCTQSKYNGMVGYSVTEIGGTIVRIIPKPKEE